MYSPAAHVAHGEQVASFAEVLNVPASQPEHVLSLVVEPAMATYWPAEHEDQAAHSVEGFASWSHLPLGHATFCVGPPGQ